MVGGQRLDADQRGGLLCQLTRRPAPDQVPVFSGIGTQLNSGQNRA